MIIVHECALCGGRIGLGIFTSKNGKDTTLCIECMKSIHDAVEDMYAEIEEEQD